MAIKVSEANSLWNVVRINDRIIVFGGHVSASVQSEFEASRGRSLPPLQGSRSFISPSPSEPPELAHRQRDYPQHQKDSITGSIAGCLRSEGVEIRDAVDAEPAAQLRDQFA
jgi:hypothetical protein